MNRGLVNGLFHALGTSRLQGGTVCDTCCETAWDLTVGPVGGADPESITQSDLIVSWGADLMATNVHLWAKVEEARKKGVQVIVIDPRRSRTAQRADWHIPIRIGTDAALALGVMHILVRDKLCDESYLATHTVGFDRVKAEILPRFAPARVAEITGLERGRRRALRRHVRAGQGLLHPPRRGHDAARPRRAGAAGGGPAAGRHGRLRPRRAAARCCSRRPPASSTTTPSASRPARPPRGSSTTCGSARRCSR